MPVDGQLARPRDRALPLHRHDRPPRLLQRGCTLKSWQEDPGEGPQVRQPRIHITSTFSLQSRLSFLAVYLLSKPRYTLTEGDFHHLKNARLTHLHMPPPALNIVTIHECESVENSITMTTHSVAKSALSIFQVTAFSLLLLLMCHQSRPGADSSINHAGLR